MKYNIFINQKKLSETNLDITDCAILSYLSDICNAEHPNIVKHRKEGYTWVHYGTLIKKMPLVKLKKSAISLRIKKITKEELIKTKIMKRILYVKFTEKGKQMFIIENESDYLDKRDVCLDKYNNNTNNNINKNIKLTNRKKLKEFFTSDLVIDNLNHELYLDLLKINMNKSQAQTVCSDADFLDDNRDVIENCLLGEIKGRPGAYLWRTYQNWLNGEDFDFNKEEKDFNKIAEIHDHDY